MAYLVVLLAAFLTKPFFNTKLCRGEYGFFKTYFLYGGIGSFAIFFGVFFLFGTQALENDQSTGNYAFLTTARLALLCLSVYLSGISWAVYKIKLRSDFSPIMNFYVVAILIVSVLLLPSVLFRAPVMCAVYAAALFVLYKTAWNGVFINKEAASD
ncbi:MULTISPECIES: hypothetical protein [Pseudomonas]|uniref:Uncharacterized protein n=1 Tax=Pseudomonas putida TaxID=303 RepID=A0A7Z9ES33_PSEPU|nr:MULTISPECIES: hypothetical protein [Pseudomonas]ELU0815087.1 hypothetical protein [Pseudomonas putida]KAF0256849.1 hypothetical protein GN299_01485 [Pseudomonas putida]MCE0780566.1 hypothetical protein [Pseudomonas sp. NMI542_15]WQE53468.1 hypothetical protein U0028_27020 [Pseudomonas putida]GLO00879.1 hypothetical protein PPUJ13061_07770 [Pseudomonas putida]